MNTMVGMQASHHTPVSEDLSDLTKNDNDPLSISGMEDDADVFDDEDFDPEELLKSPLFNDSQGRLSASFANEAGFGTFNGDSGHEPPNVTPDSSDEYISFDSPQRAEYADFSKHNSLLQPTANAFQERFNINQVALSSPMKAAAAATSTPQQNYATPMKPPPQPQFMSENEDYNILTHQSVPRQHSSMDESMGSHYTHMDESMNSNYRPESQEHALDMQQSALQRGVAQRSTGYSDQQHMRSLPERSSSFQAQHSALFARAPPGRSSSCHTPSNSSGVNQLQQMQQIQRNEGLSATVHGESMRSENYGGVLSGPMHGGDSLSHSMHARTGPSPFPVLQNQGNMSIASDMPSSKESPASLNQAMEKLCESMKRSAMSRNLVKQYSGRSLVQAQTMLGKQHSNRNLMGRQGSHRNLMDDGSGRGTPTSVMRRMSNPKHRLQHPVRGLYRHDSQQSLNGQSNHGISLQIDGRSMGTF